MTLTDIVALLQSIDLENTEECKETVRRYINAVFPLAWLHHPLRTGTIITRCRKDAPDLCKESYGCKKAEMVIDFQRASIPYETVFYGAVGDRTKEDGELIAMLETSKLHREGKTIGQEIIYVSHWRIKKNIDMAIICHPNIYINVNPTGSVKDMQINYQRRLPDYPNHDIIPEFDRLVEFMSCQFAKKVQDGDNHKYMISAYFAHNTLETEAGLIYPSVQVNGKLGFNIAIRPDIVQEYIEFVDAEKHILYKANEYMQVPANLYSDKFIATSLGIDSLDILPKVE